MKPKKPPENKMATPAKKMAMFTPAEMKWGDPPPIFTAGAKLAVLEGDPFGTGYFTVALKMPDGYKIMPHWHPRVERVTVISGEFHAGMGDKMDEAGAKTFPPGSFASIPPQMHHFAFAKGETIVMVSGPAPFKLTYVNPADDPSGMQAKKAMPAK
jgi:quercetin dioxygenase-like cupin family protein